MTGSLESIVAELKARQDIHDVLVRFCRGADLCDIAMMQSCFHDGATDDHGLFNGPAHEFARIAAESLSTLFTASRHFMTNEYVELSDNAATTETYILCHLRMVEDGVMFDVTARSRYLDRFECRNDVWKIVHRQLVSDGSRIDKVEAEYPRLDQGAPGARSPHDPANLFFARYDKVAS